MLKFKFHNTHSKLGYFSHKKGNLKFSDSKMWWREESENVSTSQYAKLHLNFQENNTQALIISKKTQVPLGWPSRYKFYSDT